MKKLLVAVLFSGSAFAAGAKAGKVDWKKVDINGDKVVDAADEAAATTPESKAAVTEFITAHDADKDGKVTEAEAHKAKK